MKIPEKTKEKKGKSKLKQIPKSKKDHVLIVAQEIKFARLLSGNEKKTRDRVLKSLKKWLLNCFEKQYEFKEDDFVRVWKGLFYAVWMSDKPLIQEELCESIAGILDVFPTDQLKHAVLMTKAGFKMLATEWYGIDHHRMDKFLMLVRRYLRGSLRVLHRSKWSLSSCQTYSKMLSSSDGLFALKTPHYARNALSMQLHVMDCYLEEISKVSGGEIPDASLVELLRPFCSYLCGGALALLCAGSRRLLTALLRQSQHGLKYQHATMAWKQMGCPEGGPDALELISDDEEQENGDEEMENGDDSGEKPLDPRAGHVDVELASLPVPAKLIVQLLASLLPSTSSKAHQRAKICMQRFEQLSRDEYPLRVREPSPPVEEVVVKPREAAHALHTLEKTLVAGSDELALRGLSRKHRKRLLAKTRVGDSIVEELEQLKQAGTSSTNGEWQVESTEPPTKKPKQDTSNKENQDKKKRKRDKTDSRLTKKPKMNGDASHNTEKVATKKSVDKTDKQKKKKHTIDNSVKSPKRNGEKHNKNNKNKIKNGESVSANNLSDKNNKIIDKSETKKQHNKTKKDNSVLKETPKKSENNVKVKTEKNVKTHLVNKVKHFQKQSKKFENIEKRFDTPKKVKFALKNNSMQGPVDYYKSVRQSPNIPYDGTRKPSKANLKPSTPSPINPFLKKKLKLN